MTYLTTLGAPNPGRVWRGTTRPWDGGKTVLAVIPAAPEPIIMLEDSVEGPWTRHFMTLTEWREWAEKYDARESAAG